MSRVALLVLVSAALAAALPGSAGTSPQPLLVFVSNRAENLFPEIYVARADGRGGRDLSRSPYEDRDATVSPAGGLVAFVSERDGSGLYVVDVGGRGLRRLTKPARTPFGPSLPSWSPDGQRIVVGESALNNEWIDVVDLRGHRRRIASSGYFATWSPDGSRIAVANQAARDEMRGACGVTSSAVLAKSASARPRGRCRYRASLCLMRDTLTYFVWGFQQHFRAGLQMETEGLLKRIGLQVKPRALLVGFLTLISVAAQAENRCGHHARIITRSLRSGFEL